MRIYGRHCLCDLFAFNFAESSFDSIHRESRKGVMFVSKEHAEIFKSIASIYVNAKAMHGIFSPILVILAKDETKMRG